MIRKDAIALGAKKFREDNFKNDYRGQTGNPVIHFPLEPLEYRIEPSHPYTTAGTAAYLINPTPYHGTAEVIRVSNDLHRS